MKKREFYAGLVSLVVAGIFSILNLNLIEPSFVDPVQINIQIYPALFFLFLGLMLIYLGLRPSWQRK